MLLVALHKKKTNESDPKRLNKRTGSKLIPACNPSGFCYEFAEILDGTAQVPYRVSLERPDESASIVV